MEIDVITLIKDLGVPVALVCYFLIKDYLFTQRIIEFLGKLTVLMDKIEDVLSNVNKTVQG